MAGYKGHSPAPRMPNIYLLLFAAALFVFTAVALFNASSSPGMDDDDLSVISQLGGSDVMLRKTQAQLCKRFKIYVYDLPAHIQMNLAIPNSDRPQHQYKFFNGVHEKFYSNYGYAESFQV